MRAYQQQAEIVRSEKLSDDIYRFTVNMADIAAGSKPGQFVMVRVAEGLDPLLRRPFSIHQVAKGGLVQILFKVVGRGTRALAGMQPGQQLDMLGPLGRGFAHDRPGQHYLVGGGIGIAPLLFLAKRMLKTVEPSAIRVLLGAATGTELDVLGEDFASLGIDVQLATEDGSLGEEGLVTELMASLPPGEGTVYACGPYPMLRVVAGISRKKGWECQVSLETMMACGLAACLGCAVLRRDMNGYVHACKDGPVFNADEVAWL
ncbi:MAG: dihydroorotate dehydrogenase electron transfer subunit [Deltaproteobacteria bacterium]|jgi:dihydroorotate dehydrogenase electron transfer subunit|nr:dihydroorotate dehydrogenase electron transfer subunit [Deltaproteobacteria bacterium]MBW2521280.1 dihydroorotate dehydrogenase electron transfer subunit [Deltaproteobacteria bacterium]